MEIKNTSNNINFKGVLKFCTILDTSNDCKFVEKIFKTTPIEDEAFLQAVTKVLANGDKTIKLSKYGAKNLFQRLKEITDARNLPNYFTKVRTKVISLTRNGQRIIYDDMECFELCGSGGTHAELDLRAPEEIKTSIRNLISNIINPLNYVSTERLEYIHSIQLRLKKLKNVALVKAESELESFLAYKEHDPENMPF